MQVDGSRLVTEDRVGRKADSDPISQPFPQGVSAGRFSPHVLGSG